MIVTLGAVTAVEALAVEKSALGAASGTVMAGASFFDGDPCVSVGGGAIAATAGESVGNVNPPCELPVAAGGGVV